MNKDQKRASKGFLESKKHAEKEVVHELERVKVSYTNVDGLIGKKLEIKD